MNANSVIVFFFHRK